MSKEMDFSNIDISHSEPLNMYDLYGRDKHSKWFYRYHRTVYVIRNLPRDVIFYIKRFIQRGIRGWADSDVWSLDSYLNGWMPDALRRLKEIKNGIPSCMYTEEEMEDPNNIDDEADERAKKQWDEILDKMIAGFEASARISELDYEKEIGISLDHQNDISREEWEQKRKLEFDKRRELMKRDQQIMDEGFQLLGKHWHSLWD